MQIIQSKKYAQFNPTPAAPAAPKAVPGSRAPIGMEAGQPTGPEVEATDPEVDIAEPDVQASGENDEMAQLEDRVFGKPIGNARREGRKDGF
jgi:hypothetical protein